MEFVFTSKAATTVKRQFIYDLSMLCLGLVLDKVKKNEEKIQDDCQTRIFHIQSISMRMSQNFGIC
jgi:hypothetical protein